MKKLILALAISALLVCLFAFTVSASDFSAVTTDATIDLSNMSTDTTSRVVLTDGENYTTYPAQYIVKSNSSLSLDFSKINTAFTKSYDKNSIVRFEVPTNVTAVPDNVIKGITALTHLYFMGDSINLQGNCVRGCKALVEVTLPSTVTFTNGYQFTDCTALTTVNCDGGLTTLSGYLFSGCSKLIDVDLSNTITTYLAHSFYDCKALPITIDLTNAKEINTKAFQNCYKLVFVNANNLSSVGQDAFRDCSGMTSVEFASNLSGIGNFAFKGTSVSSVKFNGGNYTIGGEAFNSVSTLTGEIDLTGCTSIGGSAFKSTGITSVIIPSTVTTISSYAFNSCTKLTTVTFEERNGAVLNFSGAAPFEKCTALKRLEIPEGVTQLPNSFANSCNALEYIYLPTTLTYCDDNSHFAYAGTSATKIQIVGLEKTQLSAIPDRMFRGVTKWDAETLVLPNTVVAIKGSYAFADTPFKTVYLGGSVETISTEAFVNCPNLQAVYIPSTVTSITASAFNNAKTSNILFIVTSSDTDVFAVVENSAKTNKEVKDYIKYEDFVKNPANYLGVSGRNIVYGANLCEIFYDGKCDPTTELRYDFSGAKYITSFCSYADCKRCPKAVETEVVGELFTSKGYSKSEDAFMYDIKVNFDAIEAYKDFCKTMFDKDVVLNYGLVVSGDISIDELIDSEGKEANGNVLKMVFDGSIYTNIQIKFMGIIIPEAEIDNSDVYVHACAYVIEDGKVSYVGDGVTEEKSTTVSFNSIKAN